MSGAPDVIVVAVVTSPVLAIKPPVGTKLKATWIGIAQAGETTPKAATASAAPKEFRILIPTSWSLCGSSCNTRTNKDSSSKSTGIGRIQYKEQWKCKVR